MKPCGLTVEQALKFALSGGLGQPADSAKREDEDAPPLGKPGDTLDM